MKGEGNQWWQWLRRAYKEDNKEVTWEIFVEEVWAYFSHIDYKDFNEALLKVRQISYLHDYQKRLEKLENRVQGYAQKALVRMFIGGLKAKIVDYI